MGLWLGLTYFEVLILLGFCCLLFCWVGVVVALCLLFLVPGGVVTGLRVLTLFA